jgi:hypothetical protein
MIRYYFSKYLAPIYSFKRLKNGYFYGFPAAGHSRNTIHIYDSVPNLIHIEGHIETIMYKNHFHRSIFIPHHCKFNDVQILITDGYIRLYAPQKNQIPQNDNIIYISS